MKIPKSCQYCGKAFIARTTVTKYCCDSCAKKAYKYRKRQEKIQLILKQDSQQIAKPQPVNQANSISLLNKDFLSIEEASLLIGVSRWTIQRMVKRGQLKAVTFGRKHIVLRHQIENLFN